MRAWSFAVLLVGCPLAWAEPPIVKFESLPQLVREKNENVKAAEIMVQSTKERTGFLTRSFLPSVAVKGGSESAKFGSAPVENREFWGAEARLNVYRGGRDKLEEKLRETQVEATEVDSVREYQKELREAQKLYWRLVAIGHLLTDLDEAIGNNGGNIKSAKKRSGAGVATNADALQFELQGTLLAQQKKKLALEQDLLRNNLAVAIGYDEHEKLAVQPEFPHPPEDSIPRGDLASDRNPDVRALRSLEKANALSQSLASRWWLPSLDLYTLYGRPSIRENDTRALARENEWLGGVQLSFQFDQGLEDRSTARAKELEAKAAALRTSHAVRESMASSHDLVHDLRLLHDLIHDSQADTEKAASFLKLTRSEYSRGVKNGPDLLEAFMKYYEFKTRHIELNRTFNETMADVSYHLASGEMKK